MKTFGIFKRLFACSIFLVVLVFASNAQDEEKSKSQYPRASLGILAGYSSPIGEWKKHRFAPVNQFGGGFSIGGDLEIRLSPKAGIGIVVGYTQLDVSAWEGYAATQGDEVSASASALNIGILLMPYLLDTGPSVLKLEIGAVLILPSGRERTDRFTYEYDFMRSPGFGILLGLEYEYFTGESVSFTVGGGTMIVFSGVEYADGLDNTLTLAPVMGGVKFHF